MKQSRYLVKVCAITGWLMLSSVSFAASDAQDSVDLRQGLPFRTQSAAPATVEQSIPNLRPLSVWNNNPAYPPDCPEKIICRDMNQNEPQGETVTSTSCPDVCSVKRKDTIDAVIPTLVLNSYAAICPTGYTQSGTYGLIGALTYQDKPADAPYPIPSLTSFNTYANDARYTCKLAAEKITTLCLTTDPTGNVQNDPIVLQNLVDKENILIVGGVGQYSRYINLRYEGEGIIYLRDSNCTNPILMSSRFIKHDEMFLNYYNWQLCLANPPGIYLSKTALVPEAVICTRVSAAWQT